MFPCVGLQEMTQLNESETEVTLRSANWLGYHCSQQCPAARLTRRETLARTESTSSCTAHRLLLAPHMLDQTAAPRHKPTFVYMVQGNRCKEGEG